MESVILEIIQEKHWRFILCIIYLFIYLYEHSQRAKVQIMIVIFSKQNYD